MILRLSVLAVFLALLWSCRSEDFVKTETNPQRNNADFFKHKSSLSAKNTTDYIRILEEYSQETDFLSGMPDQKGMPIWDKMKVVETKEATGLTIPLSYDNETMSSLLFVILDAKNTVNGIRNMTNDNLESLVYNPGYSIRSRESLMNTFIMMDHHTFVNEVFTNIPTDLFAGHKEGENNRLIYKGNHGDFTNTVEYNAEGKILVIYNTTCTTSWHCKNDKPIGYCDGCSKCKTTACGTTITTIFIDGNSDFPTWDGNGSEGGGDGSSGGTTAPPKDPCGLASVFYRPAPGCGGGGGTLPGIDDPCQKTKKLINNTKTKPAIDALKTKSPLGGEDGYKIKADGTPSGVIHGAEHSVNFGDKTGYAGGYHNHTPTGIPMLSPPDIDQLLGFARAQSTSNPLNVNDAFIGMVAPNGMHYVIWFNGTYEDAITNFSQEQLNKYIDKYQQRESELTDEVISGMMYMNSDGSINNLGVEKLFFETLKNMGLEGKVNLQRIENDGNVKIITLDSNNQPTPITC